MADVLTLSATFDTAAPRWGQAVRSLLPALKGFGPALGIVTALEPSQAGSTGVSDFSSTFPVGPSVMAVSPAVLDAELYPDRGFDVLLGDEFDDYLPPVLLPPVLPPVAGPDLPPASMPLPPPRMTATEVKALERLLGGGIVKPPPSALPMKSEGHMVMTFEADGRSNAIIRVRHTTRGGGSLNRKDRGAKGYYLAWNKLVTKTFGTVTELQDALDAVMWNTYVPSGALAAPGIKGKVWAKTGAVNGVKQAMAFNAATYVELARGIATGEYRVDWKGFTADYTRTQVADWEVATRGRALQRLSGRSRVGGIEATLGMWSRQHDVSSFLRSPSLTGEFLVW